MMPTIEPEQVADCECATGESPLWHPAEQRLYWTDIPTGRLFFYEPHSARFEQCYSDRPVGGFTLQADGQLLLFRDRGNVVTFRGGQITGTVINAIPELSETRFNDVIADPGGRVFAGTMSSGDEHDGKLYRIDLDGTYELVSDGNGTPNGMGFSPNQRTLYFTDSKLRRVYAYGYDAGTGALANRRVVHEVAPEQVPEQGRQDGMTVDANGHIWSARIEGALVAEYDEHFNKLRQFRFPTPKITCPTFAGPEYRDLYVTSAGGDERDTYGAAAGVLFRLPNIGRGVAEQRSRVGL